MAFRLDSAKPLSEPIEILLIEPFETNLDRNSYIEIQEKALKCRLENCGRFVLASMC